MSTHPLHKRNRKSKNSVISTTLSTTSTCNPARLRHSAEQRRIINTNHPKAVVSAVAGSGKTYTLCERIRRLIASGVDTSTILVLSFSNKAVDVISERLGRDLGVRIETFHAFGASLLPPQKFVDKDSTIDLLRQAIKDKPKTCRWIQKVTGINLKTKVERLRLSQFFECTQRDASLEQRVASGDHRYVDYLPVLGRLRRIRRAYTRLMEGQGVIDYPGMLERGTRALGRSALPYSYLFIDEFQDMNVAQAQLLSALAEKIPNVMAFGDRCQRVYSFMGSQFHDMAEVLGPGTKSMRLSRSFRLTNQSANLANAILGEEWVSGTRNGDVPRLIRCHDMAEEEQAIVTLVDQLRQNTSSSPSIAILGRTKAQLRAVEQALREAGHATVPGYRNRLPMHVKRLLRLLRVMHANTPRLCDGPKLDKVECAILEKRLLEVAKVQVSEKVRQECRRMFVDGARAPTLSGKYTMAMQIYLKLLKAGGSDMTYVEAELRFYAPMTARYHDVTELRKAIKEANRRQGVGLSTIHGAKGDEWDHVIVVGVVEGSLPFFLSKGHDDIDEERRLFYVAVTRARMRTYLFQAPFAHAPSGRRFDKKSSFITRRVMRCLV